MSFLDDLLDQHRGFPLFQLLNGHNPLSAHKLGLERVTSKTFPLDNLRYSFSSVKVES